MIAVVPNDPQLGLTEAKVTEPQQILTLVWKWLPVFRSVAETQSVSQAARALGVSPPAISRALRQMESTLGRPLFDREGRRVILNPHGELLLAALREIDVRLEEVIERLADRDAAGSVRLAAYAQLGQVFLLPAIRILNEQYPKLSLSIVHIDPEVALERVKSGMLDLFLGYNVAVGEPLTSARLGELEFAVYCGRGHPLFGAAKLDPEELEQHGFVAQRRPGLMRSIWPSSLKRKITLDTDSHAIALDACLAGTHLMFKERVTVEPLVAEGRLHELAVDAEPARLVLIRHAHSIHAAVLEKVAAAIQTVAAEIIRPSPAA